MQIQANSGDRGIAVAAEKQRIIATVFAALLAILINTIILKAAPLFHINAAAGGLFGLLRLYLGPTFESLGLSALWSGAHLPAPGSLSFWIFFHTFIGLVMSIMYVYIFRKFIPGSGWQKGAIFSLLPWIMNSAIVMPLLGKGFAASSILKPEGLIYFFFANAAFGTLLGYFYEKFSNLLQTKI